MDKVLIGRYYKKLRQIHLDRGDNRKGEGYIPIPLAVAKLYNLYSGSIYKCILDDNNIIDLRVSGTAGKNLEYGKQFEGVGVNALKCVPENVYIPFNAEVGDYLLVELYKNNYIKVKILKKYNDEYGLFGSGKDFGLLNEEETSFKLLNVTICNYKKIKEKIFQFDTRGQNIIIGPNGSGKTTILEAILYIFAALDNGINFNNNDFDFCLEYLVNDKKVKIEKRNEKFYLSYNLESGIKNIEENSLFKLRDDLKYLNVLPTKVISYYSGTHNTFEDIFTKVDASRQSFLTKKKNQLLEIESSNIDLLKKSNFKFYQGEDKMVPLYLLYIMLGDKLERNILKKYCQIDDITQITIKGCIFDNVDKFRAVLDEIQKYFTIIGFNSELNINKKEYSFKFRTEALKKIKGVERIDIFNIIINSIVLLKANLSLKIIRENENITDEMLSEGHRQIIKVIGAITLGKGGLILLDEPDSHLNPRWKYNLNDIIEQVDNLHQSTVLISTHEPLLLNGIPKEQVLILQSENDTLEVFTPIKDTYGLGIDGILTSEYFGLKSSYDKKTVEKFNRRNELFVKKLKNKINEDEKNELRNLMLEIGKMPISYNSIDYLYYEFLNVYMDTKWYKKMYLSPEEIIQKHDEFEKIIEKLYKDEGE